MRRTSLVQTTAFMVFGTDDIVYVYVQVCMSRIGNADEWNGIYRVPGAAVDDEFR